MAKAARQPAGQQRSAGLRNAQCLWFAATIAAGAIAAWSVSPWVFRAFPTDLTRTRVILDTLADSTSAPPIVVFGSSIAMASVDMERLAPPSAEGIVGWNLASTGQTPLESYLYYQELPTDVEIIVQTLSVSTLNHGGVLDAQKYNAFYMYGYRPDTRTRESMSETLGASMAALFAKSAGRHRFESRWVLRQAADWWMRNLLRTDLRIDRAMTDLVFPNSGAKEVPLTAIRAQFERSMRSGPSVFRGHPNKFSFFTRWCVGHRTRVARLCSCCCRYIPRTTSIVVSSTSKMHAAG